MAARKSSYVRRVPEWFHTRKAAQVVAFFADKAGGKINVLRLCKLVYLADRMSMDRREHPITGDDFVSMPFGPVTTYTLSYINGEAPWRSDLWAEFVAPRDEYDVPLAQPIENPEVLDELSRADRRILEDTWDMFKDIEKYDLAEWTHKYCPEWRDPSGSSVPIDFATVFKRLEKEDAIGLAEHIQAERSLSAMLAG